MITEHDVLVAIVPMTGVLMSVIGGFVVSELREIRKTSQALSESMAVIASRIEQHERRIANLERKD